MNNGLNVDQQQTISADKSKQSMQSISDFSTVLPFNKSKNKQETTSHVLDFSVPIQIVSPGVVTIYILAKPKTNALSLKRYESLQDLFRHFFDKNNQTPSNSPKSNHSKPVPVALGTGFLISKDGYIITNDHLLHDAEEIQVNLHDRSEYTAKIIGRDALTDIALLKIEGSNFKPLSLGNSNQLKVGQWVLAMGTPLGLKYTASHGIVSYLNRPLHANLLPFIQTDIAINSGNSGGPLIDLDGKVVGINSQIYTVQGGGSIGLSFSIPVNEIKYVVDQLKKNGEVQRGWIGVSFQDLTPALAKSFHLKLPKGSLISEVLPNSPADKAGFKPGDVILEFNKETVNYYYELASIIARIPINTEANALIWRDGKTMQLTVNIAKKDDSYPNHSFSSVEQSKLGLQVRELNEKDRDDLALKNTVQGVIITDIISDSIGDISNLQKGDIILKISGTVITGINVYNKVIKKIVEFSDNERKKVENDNKKEGENKQIQGKEYSFHILRGQVSQFIAVTYK